MRVQGARGLGWRCLEALGSRVPGALFGVVGDIASGNLRCRVSGRVLGVGLPNVTSTTRITVRVPMKAIVTIAN